MKATKIFTDKVDNIAQLEQRINEFCQYDSREVIDVSISATDKNVFVIISYHNPY